jgi:hypothetical protein
MPTVLKKGLKGGLIGAAGLGAAYLGAQKLAERHYRKKAEQMGVKESVVTGANLLFLLLEARKTKKPKPKRWIQGMGLKKGALHDDLGVPRKEKIPLGKIQAAANSDDPTLRRRAQLALNFRKMGK